MRAPLLSVLVALLVTTVGGCNVQMGDEEHPPAKQRVLESGKLTWDLREPPTRTQLGLSDGEDTLIYEYDDDRTIEVRIRLTGEQTLALDARYVGVSAILSGPPSIDLQFWSESLDEAKAELRRAVAQFGLPPSAVATWTEEIAEAESTGSVQRVKTPWLENRVGPALLAAQGRYFPEEETAAVSYQLSFRDAAGGHG